MNSIKFCEFCVLHAFMNCVNTIVYIYIQISKSVCQTLALMVIVSRKKMDTLASVNMVMMANNASMVRPNLRQYIYMYMYL